MSELASQRIAGISMKSVFLSAITLAASVAVAPASAMAISAATADASSAITGATSVSRYSGSPSLLAPKVDSTIAVQIFQGSIPFVGVSFIKYELQIPTAGLLNIDLNDLGFPSPAASLNFALTNSSNVLGVINGAGSLSYDVLSGPTTLFGYVYAAASPSTNQGSYSLTVTQQQAVAPVPLPAAAWLLISGLGMVGWAGRRRNAGATVAAV